VQAAQVERMRNLIRYPYDTCWAIHPSTHAIVITKLAVLADLSMKLITGCDHCMNIHLANMLHQALQQKNKNAQ
jgi:hypothetical protein